MPSGQQELSPGRAVNYQDESETVQVTASSVDAVIVSLRTYPGLKGKITGFRQAWDTDLDDVVTYSLRINGVKYPPYVDKTVQVASPGADVDLPVAIDVEQLTLVEITASGAAGMTTGDVTGRIIVKYYV